VEISSITEKKIIPVIKQQIFEDLYTLKSQWENIGNALGCHVGHNHLNFGRGMRDCYVFFNFCGQIS